MKILLAIDGSDSSQAAADLLERFPFPRASEVTLLTVLDKDVIEDRDAEALSDEERKVLQETEKSVREEAEQLVSTEAARLRKAGWGGTTEVRMGHPANEIVRAAEERQVDLVVVGSKSRARMKRFLLGSVSHKVLEYAPCSVLVVKKPGVAPVEAVSQKDEKPWQVLLAYDGSAPARKAVELCASLPLNDKAQITALTVLPLVTLYRQDIRQRLSKFWHEKKRAAQAALDAVTKEMRWATPHVSIQLRESPDVSQEILDAAGELNSALIVLGDKGKSGIERFLLGSVTHRVARHASCSVWVVRDR